MPRTADQNAVIREERRTAILEAALALFAAHGYAATSVAMIAAEARVAQGLLYRHFASKEALLLAIVERGMDDVRASFALAADASGAPGPAQLAAVALAAVRRDLHFWRLAHAIRWQTQPAALVAAIAGFNAEILATLARSFAARGAADPLTEAAILYATIDGAAQHFTLDPAGYPLETVIAALAARYTEGEMP